MTGCELVRAMKLESVSGIDLQRTDIGWSAHWDAKWGEIENWWRAHVQTENFDRWPLQELLSELQKWVPPTRVQNRAETEERVTHPRNVPVHLRGAAKIIFLGELEYLARSEENLPSPHEDWVVVQDKVEVELTRLMGLPEVTDGDPGLSRHAHVTRGLTALKNSKLFAEALLDALEDKSADDLRDSLIEDISRLLHIGFSIGFHFRAASDKAIEDLALFGADERPRAKRRLDGAAQGGRIASSLAETEREPLMQIMYDYIILKRLSVTAAARLACTKHKLGTSENAVVQTWKRYGKAFCARK